MRGKKDALLPGLRTPFHRTVRSAMRVPGEEFMGTILLIILLLIGALPTWPYSSGWGYYSSGGLGLVFLIVLILLLLRLI
jgi:hypothetical protein